MVFSTFGRKFGVKFLVKLFIGSIRHIFFYQFTTCGDFVGQQGFKVCNVYIYFYGAMFKNYKCQKISNYCKMKKSKLIKLRLKYNFYF